MTKKEKKWLKENEPWRYDELFSDPVSEQTDSSSTLLENGIVLLVVGVVLAITYFIFGVKQ
jgi:hypothetical protein